MDKQLLPLKIVQEHCVTDRPSRELTVFFTTGPD